MRLKTTILVTRAEALFCAPWRSLTGITAKPNFHALLASEQPVGRLRLAAEIAEVKLQPAPIRVLDQDSDSVELENETYLKLGKYLVLVQ
jgi:hypothetical protein